MKPKIRTAYDDFYVDPGLQQVTPDGEVELSLTIQSQAEECDINVIVDRYAKTGILHIMQKEPFYGDVTDAPTYQESLNIVIQAEKAFNALPASIRKQFDNNPAEFLAFVDNPENGDKLVEMGLREAPLPVPATPEPKKEE